MPNFRIVTEKTLVLVTPKVGIFEKCYLKSAVRSRPFENVRNKDGCVVSSIGKVDLSFGFDDTI